jgi:4-hydroxy-tetrahydrodipicolinate reductase
MTTLLGISGAAGRMGLELQKALIDFDNLVLGAALESSLCPLIGKPVNSQSALVYVDDVLHANASVDGWIDFSSPEQSLLLASWCAERGLALVVGTTCLTQEQHILLASYAKKTAIMYASNFSIGVAAMKRLCSQAQQMLGADFDIEILDLHHKAKVDAPSGTAKALISAINFSGQVVCDRSSSVGARNGGDIGCVSLRGGDVVGEHTMYLIGAGERIEITHRAWNRAVFARGALRAFTWLTAKKPGLYSIEDMFNEVPAGI